MKEQTKKKVDYGVFITIVNKQDRFLQLVKLTVKRPKRQYYFGVEPPVAVSHSHLTVKSTFLFAQKRR